MAKFCPHCGAEIETIKYTADCSGTEYGRCVLSEDGDYFEEFERDDYEINNTDHYYYMCPQCDGELTIDNIVDNQTKSPQEEFIE